MSTAAEMELRAVQARRYLDVAARLVHQQMVEPLTVIALGREICARRARKLRKRGDRVQFKQWTANRKCRYCWVPVPFRFELTGDIA